MSSRRETRNNGILIKQANETDWAFASDDFKPSVEDLDEEDNTEGVFSPVSLPTVPKGLKLKVDSQKNDDFISPFENAMRKLEKEMITPAYAKELKLLE